MSSVWNNAKSQIVEMVSRIIAIGGAGKSELMWVAYRYPSYPLPLLPLRSPFTFPSLFLSLSLSPSLLPFLLFTSGCRDYSDAKRLECSAWSNNPAVLKDFINKIVCDGGGDYPEAVELGLEQVSRRERERERGREGERGRERGRGERQRLVKQNRRRTK